MTDLATVVIEAFTVAPRPAADNIAPHAFCGECDAVTKYLEGRDPCAFDAEALLGCIWDMPLLSAEAKRFYLPAWLLASMNPSRRD